MISVMMNPPVQTSLTNLDPAVTEEQCPGYTGEEGVLMVCALSLCLSGSQLG